MSEQQPGLYQAQPQYIAQPAQQPQIFYVQQPQPQPQPQPAQPVIINNVTTTSDTTVNHGTHALLCCCTGGIWAPVWLMACLGLGCERPCG